MRGAGAPDPRLLLEVAVVRSARREARAGIDAVLERIERLEAHVEQLAAGGTGGSGGGGGGPSAAPAPKPNPQKPAASTAPPRPAAPAKPAPSATAAEEPEPTKAMGKARAALGAFTRNEPSAPPTTPAPPAEAADENAAASNEPLDFDDVIVAWSHTLESLNNVARAMVQAAVPIGLDGDTVVFGVPKSQLVAVQTPFRNNADEIRGELAKHLGRRMMFKLAEHDFDAPGALQPRINAAAEPEAPTTTAAAGTAPRPEPAPAAKSAAKRTATPGPATSRSADAPPPEEPPDDFEVDLSDLIDARDAPPLRDTAQLLMSEFGAQVVEERPLGQ